VIAVRLPAHVDRRHVLAAAAGCAALAVVGLIDPAERALTPPCPLRAITGLDCPLCGATRATHALLHGQLAHALDLNALYVLALPVLAAVTALWLRSGQVPGFVRRRATPWAMLAVAVAFGIVRNLSPFTVLRS
jgi:hypothetical protein